MEDREHDLNEDEMRRMLLLLGLGLGLLIERLPMAVARIAQTVEMLSSEESRAQRTDFSRRAARDFRMLGERLSYLVDMIVPDTEQAGKTFALLGRALAEMGYEYDGVDLFIDQSGGAPMRLPDDPHMTREAAIISLALQGVDVQALLNTLARIEGTG